MLSGGVFYLSPAVSRPDPQLTHVKCPGSGSITMERRGSARPRRSRVAIGSGVADFTGSETAGPIPHDSMPVAGSEHALKAARWNALRTSSLAKAPALSLMWPIALATTGGRSPEALRPPALGRRSLCQGAVFILYLVRQKDRWYSMRVPFEVLSFV
jgi:hypothetical protein